MNVSKRIAHNLVFQLIGKALSIALGLLAIAGITRYLGANGFGDYTTINTFLSFFAVIADFGLTLVTAQMISADPDREKKLLNNLFSFRLISAVIILGLGPWLIWLMPYSQEIKIGAIICSWSYIFIAFNQTFIGLFQKKLTMQLSAIAEVFNRIVFLAGVFWVIKYGHGLIGIMWVTSLSGFAGFVLHYIFTLKIHRLKPEFDWTIWKLIARNSWPLLLTITSNLIYLRADTLILSLLKPSYDVGLYGAAYKIIDVLSALPFMFAGLILPLLTQAWVAKEKSRFFEIIQRSLDLMIIAAIPLVVGTQMVAKEIIILMAGGEFAAAAPILKLLMLAIAFIFLGCIFSHAIIALGQQKKSIPFYLFTSLTALVGYLIMIPKFSYFGAAIITIYSEATIAILSAWFVARKTGMRINIRMLWKSAAASAIMALALYLWPSNLSSGLWLMTKIAAGAITYGVAMIAFKAIAIKDLTNILYGRKNETKRI